VLLCGCAAVDPRRLLYPSSYFGTWSFGVTMLGGADGS
jgi:hypothetical protein